LEVQEETQLLVPATASEALSKPDGVQHAAASHNHAWLRCPPALLLWNCCLRNATTPRGECAKATMLEGSEHVVIQDVSC